MNRRSVVLGVGGGIAAYKSCELVRLLDGAGADVRVIPTRAALSFVGAATFEALSHHPVTAELFEDVPEVAHVRIGAEADLVIVAPATADLLARAAAGFADDLLTATLLVARAPMVFAPAMHTQMWEHPATQANVATLRSRGAIVVEPDTGRLTGADSGPGRLPEPERLAELCLHLLERRASTPTTDLSGLRFVVSAGGTREPLDPVRFLGNRSSGRQGVAIARAAIARGAEVTLIAAHLAVPPPAGARVIEVDTAQHMCDATTAEFASADVLVMAAAVADFRPGRQSPVKIKKGADEPTSLELVRNPDILAQLSAEPRRGRTVVGFAAETGDAHGSVLEHARRKLASKGCDLLVVNEVGETRGFETEDNAVTILARGGEVLGSAAGSKSAVADAILDRIVTYRTAGHAEGPAHTS